MVSLIQTPPRSMRSGRIAELTPDQSSRSLIVGWTGSGKSTLTEILVDSYHQLYPDDWLYIFDPKPRYAPVDAEDGDIRLFPDGYEPRVYGKRKAVPIVGSIIDRPRQPRKGEGVLLIHDADRALALFDWLDKHSDVNTPAMVCIDEPLDLLRGFFAHPSFKKTITQGREKGIGAIVLSQRPRGIDGTWISESQYVYAGSLIKWDDRRYVADNVAVPNPGQYFNDPLPDYHWLRFDQRKRSVRGPFTLDIGVS